MELSVPAEKVQRIKMALRASVVNEKAIHKRQKPWIKKLFRIFVASRLAESFCLDTKKIAKTLE
jgi:hypothetical protein